ncbi:hypothetical protein [Microbispora bryophytorum]|uniref:Radical SAM protein n=1 Tax=Microbispora bryophytorum subsp. camponoti TaxID=1677852 RepID=A0ABR8LBK0_9ACTN|nr:hypothetical protein [Microbispora camponoti]MBD3148236.1 hypothetical protein [Microbispora camponoti]
MPHEQSVDLIAEHETWISVDPILGCPANCAYCYLGPLRLRGARPRSRSSPEQLGAALRKYLYGRRAELIDPETDQTPICLGNYTDMLMTPANRDAVIEYVGQIVRVLPNSRPIVLVTKSRVPENLVETLDDFDRPILWFFSQSFARDLSIPLEAGPISNFDATLENARVVSAARNQKAVHFWRPFVRELSAGLHDKGAIVRRLREAKMTCSVVVGLKHGPGVPLDDPRLSTHIPSHSKDADETGEAFDHLGWRRLVAIAKSERYPLYRHTSCAIALAANAKERLGTWGPATYRSHCLPSSCPAAQRGRCGPEPDHSDASRWRARISAFLRLPGELITRDPGTGRFEVNADVSEFDYNTILHAAKGRYSMSFRSVTPQKAWFRPR